MIFAGTLIWYQPHKQTHRQTHREHTGTNKSTHIWIKVFKNGPSKICGRQPLLRHTISVHITLKAVFHEFFLVHSWIPWPIYKYILKPSVMCTQQLPVLQCITRPLQEIFNTCVVKRMHIVMWAIVCLLFLRFYNLIKGIVRIDIVFLKKLRP